MTGRKPTRIIAASLRKLIDAGGTLGASSWGAGSSTVRIAKTEGWITSRKVKREFSSVGFPTHFSTETQHTITDAGRKSVTP